MHCARSTGTAVRSAQVDALGSTVRSTVRIPLRCGQHRLTRLFGSTRKFQVQRNCSGGGGGGGVRYGRMTPSLQKRDYGGLILRDPINNPINNPIHNPIIPFQLPYY